MHILTTAAFFPVLLKKDSKAKFTVPLLPQKLQESFYWISSGRQKYYSGGFEAAWGTGHLLLTAHGLSYRHQPCQNYDKHMISGAHPPSAE